MQSTSFTSLTLPLIITYMAVDLRQCTKWYSLRSAIKEIHTNLTLVVKSLYWIHRKELLTATSTMLFPYSLSSTPNMLKVKTDCKTGVQRAEERLNGTEMTAGCSSLCYQITCCSFLDQLERMETLALHILLFWITIFQTLVNKK